MQNLARPRGPPCACAGRRRERGEEKLQPRALPLGAAGAVPHGVTP